MTVDSPEQSGTKGTADVTPPSLPPRRPPVPLVPEQLRQRGGDVAQRRTAAQPPDDPVMLDLIADAGGPGEDVLEDTPLLDLSEQPDLLQDAA